MNSFRRDFGQIYVVSMNYLKFSDKKTSDSMLD
jgi:hypothetical protein